MALTRTDIANSALSYLSASSIASFFDADDEKARVIKSVFDSVAQEVIRSHRWSCCIRRVQLSELADKPLRAGDFGYNYQYEIPVDCLRFLDLSGEPWNAKTQTFDLNGRKLQTNDSTAYIRYVAWIEDTAQWDVMLCEAIAVKLAMRIARRITKDGASGEQLYALYKDRLAEARHVDAMEVGSGENRPLERILENSPLVQSGRSSGRYFRPAAIIGLNVNLEQDR